MKTNHHNHLKMILALVYEPIILHPIQSHINIQPKQEEAEKIINGNEHHKKCTCAPTTSKPQIHMYKKEHKYPFIFLFYI